MAVISAFIIICSLLGNGLVIYIVATRSHMRNSTNILIANMAIADTLMALDVLYVSKWLYVGSQWFGSFVGVFTCRLFHSMQVLTITSSVLTLVVISLDRCLVIWFPLRQIFSKSKVLKSVIAAIWVLAVAISVPLFAFTKLTQEDDETPQCDEHWPSPVQSKLYMTIFVTCAYFLPLVTITVVYALAGIKLWTRKLPGHHNLITQKKVQDTAKKVTTMLVTVVLVFALCWLPLQVRELLIIHHPEALQKIPLQAQVILPWIGFSNSAINPCLYVIFSENYRREFRRILCCFAEVKTQSTYQGIPSCKGTPLSTPALSRRAASMNDVPLRILREHEAK